MSFAVRKDLSVSSLKVGGIDINDMSGTALYQSGYTVDTAGGAQTITAAELVHGYYYKGDPGAGVALTMPTAASVQAYLLTRGITSVAGMRLRDILIDVTTANALTVTGNTGVSVLGAGAATTVAVNDKGAVCRVIFTGAATIDVIVTLSS